MKNDFIYSGLSLQNRRKTNMDTIILLERVISGENSLLITVCDGVGSLADGGVASTQIVNHLSEWFYRLVNTEIIGLKLRDEISAINRTIIDYALEHSIQTASTLSALFMTENSYYIVNIGDSRVYSVTNKELTQLTYDDSAENGALTAAIGFSQEPVLFYSEGQIDKQQFIVCSDGFYKRLDDEYLLNNISYKSKKDIDKSIRRIVDYVIGRGEKDNISVAFARKDSK